MEIVGIGTDIVECVRIGRMIEQHGELFLTRVFTEREVRYCRSRQRSTELFAAHWAAKEAIIKCLGKSWHRELPWTDMEVRHDGTEPPKAALTGTAADLAQSLHIGDIHLSLAHCRAYATAYALAVRNGGLYGK